MALWTIVHCTISISFKWFLYNRYVFVLYPKTKDAFLDKASFVICATFVPFRPRDNQENR